MVSSYTWLLRLIWILLAAGAAVWLVLVALLWYAQDSLVFIGKGRSPLPDTLPASQVTLATDVQLQGWHVRRTGPWTLVYFGGNGEEISRSLPGLLRIDGQHLLTFNYRGFGDSQGEPSEVALVADGVAALDWLWRSGTATPATTIVMGRSLGTAVAVQVAARQPVRGVVLLNPMDSIAEVAATHYPAFPVRTLVRHPFDSVAVARDLDTPALVFKAERDVVVPHKHTEALIAAWRGPVTEHTLPGTNHNAMLTPAFFTTLDAWLAALAGASAPSASGDAAGRL